MQQYKYSVTTTHPFPIDMLRYDACWPATSGAAVLIADSISKQGDACPKGGRVIELVGLSEPTVGRWRSLLCTVGKVVREKRP